MHRSPQRSKTSNRWGRHCCCRESALSLKIITSPTPPPLVCGWCGREAINLNLSTNRALKQPLFSFFSCKLFLETIPFLHARHDLTRHSHFTSSRIIHTLHRIAPHHTHAPSRMKDGRVWPDVACLLDRDLHRLSQQPLKGIILCIIDHQKRSQAKTSHSRGSLRINQQPALLVYF